MFKTFSKPRRVLCALLACLTILICGLCGCSKEETGITGNEWLVKQKVLLEDLSAFTEGMDEVYSLYLVGGISESDFLTELRLLKQQYAILNQFYAQLKNENPVKEGTHSYVSKRGSDAIANYYTILGEVIDNSVDEKGSPLKADQLAYVYMAYQQQLTSALAEYTTAIIWLEEGQTNE